MPARANREPSLAERQAAADVFWAGVIRVYREQLAAAAAAGPAETADDTQKEAAPLGRPAPVTDQTGE